jgi:hypothetical protein
MRISLSSPVLKPQRFQSWAFDLALAADTRP